jgi:hypothetical protein
MVGDTPVAITEKGLVVGSSPVPADPKPIEDALAQAKIGVEIMPRQDTDTGVVAPALRVTQRDDAGQSITYVLGRTFASATGAGTLDAPAASDSATSSGASSSSDQTGGVGADTAPAGRPASFVAPPATAAEEASAGVEVPTSFVLPDPAPVGAGASNATSGSGESATAPTVVRLASGNGLAGAPARDTRRAAARLLITASDTTPLFWVLALGLASALGTALFLRRLGSRLR